MRLKISLNAPNNDYLISYNYYSILFAILCPKITKCGFKFNEISIWYVKCLGIFSKDINSIGFGGV